MIDGMPKKVNPGKFYAVTDDRMVEVGAQDDPALTPDVWICRRLSDYNVPVPQAAAVGNCTRCGERVVYNPARRVNAPRVCMQCAGIEPLPFTP